MNELISVIVPIYNTSPDLLGKCLICIKEQSYKNIEVVCVDASTLNETKKVIKDFLKDRRFRLIETESGVSNQRNIGIENSYGDYILFVDSDDFFDENFISHLYKNLVLTNSDIAIPLVYRSEFINGIMKQEIPYEINQVPEMVDEQNYFQYCRSGELVRVTKLYKKDLIKNIRFKKSSSYGEDLIFNHELSKITYKTVYVPESIYHYRVNVLNNSASRRLDKKGLFIIQYLANIIRNKSIKSKEALVGLYSEFDLVFNSFLYAIARQRKRRLLVWMTRYNFIYLKRHHSLHDILYLLFPVLIVKRRDRRNKI